MATTTASKKRKRDDDADKGTFQLSSQPASQLGPVLVSWPALEPSKSIPFRCYLRKKQTSGEGQKEEGEEEFSRQDALVVGESDSVEFFSSDETKVASVGSRYYIAVHNRRTRMTSFRPAPLHILTRQVKAFKGLETAPVTLRERVEARAALGESFGTKKAQAAIRSAERNKVDVGAMEGVMVHLVDRIERSTGALPSKDEMKTIADSHRLIPPFNSAATVPSEVYNLHDIIPEAEWKALSISAFTAATRDNERVALLPFKRSDWINHHLKLLFKNENEKPSKRNIKILYYTSTMLAFHQVSARLDKAKLAERLSGVPSIIVDGLLSRFSETARGSTDAQTTTETQTNLLTHIFALCLRIDDYATDTSVVAKDLHMPVPRVNVLFKSLGCKIEILPDKELKRLGLPSSAAETKRAVLKVPLEFPKPKFSKKTRK